MRGFSYLWEGRALACCAWQQCAGGCRCNEAPLDWRPSSQGSNLLRYLSDLWRLRASRLAPGGTASLSPAAILFHIRGSHLCTESPLACCALPWGAPRAAAPVTYVPAWNCSSPGRGSSGDLGEVALGSCPVHSSQSRAPGSCWDWADIWGKGDVATSSSCGPGAQQGSGATPHLACCPAFGSTSGSGFWALGPAIRSIRLGGHLDAGWSLRMSPQATPQELLPGAQELHTFGWVLVDAWDTAWSEVEAMTVAPGLGVSPAQLCKSRGTRYAASGPRGTGVPPLSLLLPQLLFPPLPAPPHCSRHDGSGRS